MTTFTFYRTESYGGIEGRDIITKDYETKEIAMKEAENDTWNSNYTIYKVTMTINEVITYKVERIGAIPCGREIAREKEYNAMSEEQKKRVWKPSTNWTGWKN